MRYDNVKIPAVPIPKIGTPYVVVYPWCTEAQIRVRGGGVKRVRWGWYFRKYRKSHGRNRR